MSDLKLTPDDIYALARGCRVMKPKLREATEYETYLAQEVERLTSANKDKQELYEDASAAGMALGVKYAELQAEIAKLKEQLAAREAQVGELREALEKYADRSAWGYLDSSGCLKGVGRYTDHCIYGPEIAEKALSHSTGSKEDK